jgi:hypothetical protein
MKKDYMNDEGKKKIRNKIQDDSWVNKKMSKKE